MNEQYDKILFLRYNPDKFKIDDDIFCKISQKDREKTLIYIISNYEPDKKMEILYLYYDHRSDGNYPEVYYQKEYNNYLKKCIIVHDIKNKIVNRKYKL